MSKSSSNSLLELFLLIATLVGVAVILVKVCEWLFGSKDSTPDLRQVLQRKDRQIDRLVAENERLASFNGALAEENACLRKLLHWWSLVRDFCARIAARLLIECAKASFGLIYKFV